MPPTSQSPWLKGAIILILVTIFYNIVEAVVSIWAGRDADSIALLGFGLDSLIEITAAVVVLWRLVQETTDQDEDRIKKRERVVKRIVGGTFFALAAFILAEATMKLTGQEMTGTSLVGIIVAVLSILIMPPLAKAKLLAAEKIGSDALKMEAKETLACSYLSFTLLLGLVFNMFLAWWWVDPVAALLMVPWLIKEGLEGIRGESCYGD